MVKSVTVKGEKSRPRRVGTASGKTLGKEWSVDLSIKCLHLVDDSKGRNFGRAPKGLVSLTLGLRNDSGRVG